MENKWDNLAKYFHGNNPGSADNIEIVEPILIEELRKIENLRLIDFGCGSGNFCKRVSKFAERVLGIDNSKEMINLAKRKNTTKNVEFDEEFAQIGKEQAAGSEGQDQGQEEKKEKKEKRGEKQ